MQNFDKVYFTLNNKRRLGYVRTINSKTIWVRLLIGASNAIVVKRHIVKHNVKFYGV